MSKELFALLVPIFLGLAYITGYSYLDGFYEYFNVSLGEVQPSLQEVFAHSAVALPELVESSEEVLVSLGVATVFVLACFILISSADRRTGAVLLIAAFFILAIQNDVHDLGLRRGQEDMDKLLPVHFEQKFGESLPEYVLVHQSEYKLMNLVATEDYYIAVAMEASDRWWTIRIPRSEVFAMRSYQE